MAHSIPATTSATHPASLNTTSDHAGRARATPRSRRFRLPVSSVRRAAAVSVVAGLAVLTSACGSDDVGATATSPSSTQPATATSAPATPTTDTPATGAPAGPGDHTHREVPVTAVDFAFEGLPATIEADSRLTLTNAAAHELHELVAIRLPDSEQRPVAELMKLGPAEVDEILGSTEPVTVLVAAPGEDQITAVGDGTLTETGRYVLLCAIPMGVDPAEYLAAAAAAGGAKPDVQGGPPHLVAGMVAEITVV